MRSPDRKVAVVTGATSGIGIELARLFVASDVEVWLCGRNYNKASALARELSTSGGTVIPFLLDVTNRSHIFRLVENLRARGGRLDILVNNAAVMFRSNLSDEALDLTYKTNVVGPLLLIEALLPFLLASEAGRIVNQSSLLGSLSATALGDFGEWDVPIYACTKAALNMLTVHYAARFAGTQLKINSAHPGWVKTSMGGEQATSNASEGAQTAFRLSMLSADGPSGGFFYGRRTLPW